MLAKMNVSNLFFLLTIVFMFLLYTFPNSIVSNVIPLAIKANPTYKSNVIFLILCNQDLVGII